MKRHLPLLLLPLLSACKPQGPSSDDYAIMSRFDPAITTIPIELARNTARYANDTVRISPGRYCQGFEQSFLNETATARLELTIFDGNKYQLAGRYTYKNLVRNLNGIGFYTIRGHAFEMINKAGEQTTWALTSTDPNTINVWGNLPMTRSACTNKPLSGSALQAAIKAAQDEQSKPTPWSTTKPNDITTPNNNR